MDQKIVKLKAKLAGTLYELLVNTRIDNVHMLDGTLLADKLQEIVNAVNAREKIVDVDRKIDAAKTDIEAATSEEVNQLRSDLTEETVERKAEIAVERARINAFTSLPEGSTTGDAELRDARIDKDGNTHPNVGEHIRNVTGQLSSEIVDIQDKVKTVNLLDSSKTVNGKFIQFVDDKNIKEVSTPAMRYILLDAKEGDVFRSNCQTIWVGVVELNGTTKYVDYGFFTTQEVTIADLQHANVESKGIYVSVDTTNNNRIMITKNENIPSEYVEFGTVIKDFTMTPTDRQRFCIRNKIEIFPTSNIMDFYNSMLYSYTVGDCDVYIRKGTYEYTNEMIESIRAEGKRGVPIGNNCRYFFDTGASIVCNYTGDNYIDVGSMFSPLDSWNQGGNWELHNLNLLASGCIYGVHDEGGGSDTPYTHLYDNCKILLDNTNARYVGYNRAIGGGLGQSCEIIARNCYFEATTNEEVDISWHGGVNGNNDRSHFAISNCYFKHSFGIDAPEGTSNKKLLFSCNSVKTDIVHLQETGSTWEVYSWGNTIRND